MDTTNSHNNPKYRYISIDLKSFYASVECTDRKLNPLTTNLVVADESRTEKTICLAVSPALKSFGIPGRPRLFEVIQAVNRINAMRRMSAPGRQFSGKSTDIEALNADPSLELDFIIAIPRMGRYIEYSTRIYQIYLRHIAPEDIHVYSIDEVFIDVLPYCDLYGQSARSLAMTMIREVLNETGITATAGIGTNLYLAKIAMDIVAKHIPADEDGVRLAELDEISYRRKLWEHRPLTDFWRVGHGIAKSLDKYGINTMGDIASLSLHDPGLLYKLFGINAELLIDHAWGYEPCTIAMIKSYRPENNSIGSGQVLQCPYSFKKARIIVREMTDLLVLDLVEKALITDQMVLTINYDVKSLEDPVIAAKYHEKISSDRYGRKAPSHAHGSTSLSKYTSSTSIITEAVLELYDRIVDPLLLVRRITITANNVIPERDYHPVQQYEQMNFFTDYEERDRREAKAREEEQKERSLQRATIAIQKKFGKNAMLRGTDFLEGATTRERNEQVGGHKK